jgi:ATP-binding cassette, subfamily F, member 3
MICIDFSNVSFSFPDKSLLNRVSFRLSSHCRTGLIGLNGTGKTTVFRLLTGALEPDSGAVIRMKDLKMGVLQQELETGSGRTLSSEMERPFVHLKKMASELSDLYSAITQNPDSKTSARYDKLLDLYQREGGYEYHARIQEVLNGLGFKDPEMDRSILSFSGGERARIQLARLLLEDSDLLLLDEPTNHLDVESIEWLEKYLGKYAGGVIVISHDRYFLDRVVNEILDLKFTRIDQYKGNYSEYVQLREERYRLQAKRYRHQQEQIEQMEDFVKRNIAGQKTKLAQSRLNTLERMERIEKPDGWQKVMKLQFQSKAQSGRIVLELENIGKRFNSHNLFSNVNLKIHRGEIIGVLGPNGSGKTSLLKVVTSEIQPDEGEIHFGHRVMTAYFDQHLQNLDDKKSVLDEIWQVRPNETQHFIRSHAGKFLFTGDDVYQDVGSLSGGEKARVALAKLLLKRANLLILDEPTNHLDMDSKEVLEEALLLFPGTVLIVTHDRYLLNKISDRIWSIEDHTVRDYLGNYSRYQELRAAALASDPGSKSEKTTVSSGKPSRKDIRKARADIRKKTGKSAMHFEKEIERLESELRTIGESMKNPDLATDWAALDELVIREKAIQKTLHDVMEKWAIALEEEEKLKDMLT